MKIYAEGGQCFADMEYQLTINETEAFHQEMSALLDTNNEFVIHCVDLKEIDAAGLQALISLKKELEHQSKVFELTVGKKIKEIMQLFFLEDYFKEVVV